MATITRVSDLAQFSDEQQVMAVRGIVTKLFPRKAGFSDKGDWSFQNFTLKDGNATFPVTLNNRDALPKSLENKMVLLSCTQSKNGWHGVKVKLNSYEDKNGNPVSQLVLWVTGAASIEEYSEQAQQPPPPQPQQQTPAPEKPAAPRSATPPVDSKGTPLIIIGKMAQMMVRCHGAAILVAKQISELDGSPVAPERVDAIRTTLFIQASYDKLYHQFPTIGAPAPAPQRKPPPPPPPPEPPEPEPEDDVPF